MQRTKLTLGALVASTALAGMASAQTELTLWYHGYFIRSKCNTTTTIQ